MKSRFFFNQSAAESTTVAGEEMTDESFVEPSVRIATAGVVVNEDVIPSNREQSIKINPQVDPSVQIVREKAVIAGDQVFSFADT